MAARREREDDDDKEEEAEEEEEEEEVVDGDFFTDDGLAERDAVPLLISDKADHFMLDQDTIAEKLHQSPLAKDVLEVEVLFFGVCADTMAEIVERYPLPTTKTTWIDWLQWREATYPTMEMITHGVLHITAARQGFRKMLNIPPPSVMGLWRSESEMRTVSGHMAASGIFGDLGGLLLPDLLMYAVLNIEVEHARQYIQNAIRLMRNWLDSPTRGLFGDRDETMSPIPIRMKDEGGMFNPAAVPGVCVWPNTGRDGTWGNWIGLIGYAYQGIKFPDRPTAVVAYTRTMEHKGAGVRKEIEYLSQTVVPVAAFWWSVMYLRQKLTLAEGFDHGLPLNADTYRAVWNAFFEVTGLEKGTVIAADMITKRILKINSEKKKEREDEKPLF